MTKFGCADVGVMAVDADSPHSHAGKASGEERGVVHVPHSPLHEAHRSCGQDPSYGGNSETCYLAIGTINKQGHGGSRLRETAKNRGHGEVGTLGSGTAPPWVSSSSREVLYLRKETVDPAAVLAGVHPCENLQQGHLAILTESLKMHRPSNRLFHFWVSAQGYN